MNRNTLPCDVTGTGTVYILQWLLINPIAIGSVFYRKPPANSNHEPPPQYIQIMIC